ncbi:MAG TPA: glycoside hydrolase family 98 domain-containing protein [Candidatus Latescibacteria bacterium]|nr:glycoside hydrolase family 98 domain-containing protein [Candidatus Latescibacterota bacterium]
MKTPLKVTISPSHPLLILMSPGGPSAEMAAEGFRDEEAVMVRCWELLDDEIRPYTTVHFGATRGDNFAHADRLLRAAQTAGIPVTLQTQTDNANIQDAMPPERVRRFLDTYPCIVGLQIDEASQRTFVNHGGGPEYTMGRNARYARDIIRLAAEYGCFMSWQLMRDNWAAIGCSADNEALYDAICEYSEYVIPMHEMNCEFSKFINHLSCMGLWLAGATQQWGIEAQSWYWYDCGYNKPGTCEPGTLEMPGELYAIMFLLGVSAGASVFSIEPPTDNWPGPGHWRFTEWIAPVFKRLLREHLIPSVEEILASTPLAYHLPRCERPVDYHKVLADLDFDHGEGRLIRVTYGVFDRARDAEFIPNNPRYGWIPVLPAKTPESLLSRVPRVIRPGDIQSIEEARKVAEEEFPQVDRGQAWSVGAGRLLFAVNTHENWYISESVKLSVPVRPDGVRLEDSGAVSLLRWNRHPGDRAYRVWRLREGVERCLTEYPVQDTEYRIHEPANNDFYSVSAITDATELISGTLHLHQFLLFSCQESRRSEWVSPSGESEEHFRIGESMPLETDEIARAEARASQCSPVEDLASPPVAEDDPWAPQKCGVIEAMVGWKSAVESEEIPRIMAFYAEDYREPDGRTRESVEVAFRNLFRRYVMDRFEPFLQEWGAVPGWQFPALRLLIREWGEASSQTVEVSAVAHLWAGGGPELEPSDMIIIPFGRPSLTTFVWTNAGRGWKLAKTAPAFLQVEDTAVFRFRYQGW